MKKWLPFLVLSFAFIACQNNTKDTTGSGENSERSEPSEQIQTLKKETLQLHDEVMSKMNKMGHLRSELKDKSAQAKADSAAMVKAEAQLADAKEEMMNWMRNFQDPAELDVSEEEKVDYLLEQRETMREIQQYTQESIQKAEKLIEDK